MSERPALTRSILFGVLALGAASGSALAADPDPAYEPQLLRLAELLGGLTFLRPLCGGADGGVWRAEMATLIDAEQPSEARKARLVDRFNIGYSSFAAVYQSCTPAASLEAERYRREGAEIAHDLATRFVR